MVSKGTGFAGGKRGVTSQALGRGGPELQVDPALVAALPKRQADLCVFASLRLCVFVLVCVFLVCFWAFVFEKDSYLLSSLERSVSMG